MGANSNYMFEEEGIVYVVSSFNRKHNDTLDPDTEKYIEGVYKNLNDAKEQIINFIKNTDTSGYDADISVYDTKTGERINIIYLKHFWSDEVKDVNGKAISI